ncbi:MAG: diguanylate cyclase [Sedimentisphaerales bacterium]|nr:diguanylate cyclase [Sedimentisphaerales bacterium]
MKEAVTRPTKVITITKSENIKIAAEKMLREKIGCLIVNDENGKFVGLLTERDIANRIAVSSEAVEKTTVGQIMTAHVVWCAPGTPASKAREIMTNNKIRHLPIIDNNEIVGILSVRDLMEKQLLEDRAAAKEVAMLSKCLKSIDMKEAADIVTKEVPKLFQAEKCVLCLFKKDSDTESTELLSYNHCPCPEANLKCQGPEAAVPLVGQQSTDKSSASQFSDDEEPFTYDTIPDACRQLGAQGPRLVIPMTIAEHKGTSAAPILLGKTEKGTFMDPKYALSDTKNHLSGYLCMCGLKNFGSSNWELTGYKAKLTKDILTSHLTNASLYQHARLTSLTDALTGIGSRKLLEDRLQAEAARAKRYKRPFSVAIIDLDNFKTINDVLGHATGDDALRKLAACMKAQKRTPDVLARYGGDEFVILMPETKAGDAVVLLERIRSEVEKIKVAENVSMTISCGIAQSIPDSKDTPSEIIRRADLALYEAKNAGRNCVKLWDKSMSKTQSIGDIEIDKIRKLKRRIAGLSEQAEKMFIQSIWGLVQALEAKDPYAGKHSENVMYYSMGIAQTMNIHQKQQEIIRRAAMIHDIGKIGVPDAILSKKKRLTMHERGIIEQHPLIAVRILEKMSFLEQEVSIVRCHHEKWNGQGYPDGLSHSAIPIGARILTVADTFDALTSERSYHQSLSVNEAIKTIVNASGYDFDPDVVKAFVEWVETIRSQSDLAEQLTPADLLNSQVQSEQSTTEEIVAERVPEKVAVS